MVGIGWWQLAQSWPNSVRNACGGDLEGKVRRHELCNPRTAWLLGLDSNQRPSDKPYTIYDGQVPGFGIRVQPGGTKTYVVLYRFAHHRRCVSLGHHGVTTPEQARTSAINILARVRNGEDPAARRQSGGHVTTVSGLAKRFDEEHIAVRLKLSSARSYRDNLRRHVLPAIGKLRAAEVTRADVAKLHHDLRHSRYQANRSLALMSKMFNLAEVWGVRPGHSNPCWGIKKYPEEKRERFLSTDELARLGEALRQSEKEGIETQSSINAIRLLVFTGCRLSEIQTLKWDYVDLDNGVLRLPDSKTGAKVVHIGGAAVRVLADIGKIENNPWVITGRRPGSRLTDLQHPWRRIRARADIADVRIHDLRHTFASVAVASGKGLPIIGKMLGHTQVQTTARYAHLAADPVKQATADVSASIEAALEGEVTT